MKKMSFGAMVAMTAMVLGLIALFASLPMMVMNDRPAWVIIILSFGGMLAAIIGGFFCDVLTRTEEEGKLPKLPPKTENGSCGEDSGRHC